MSFVHTTIVGGVARIALDRPPLNVLDIGTARELAAGFGFPEIRLGVFPPVAAVLLTRMIPAHVAAELILTGRTLTAVEAERVGLVNRVTEDDALDGAVDQVLAGLCALSASSLRVAKQAMRLSKIRAVPDAVGAAESHYLRRLLEDRDAIEGLSAFLEKRPPAWRS